MTDITPKRLAIYYGYPSLVNGASGDIAAAVATFSQYDLLVLGANLEQKDHPDNVNTKNIIQDPAMVNCMVAGYIDSTLDIDIIQDKIDLWYAMGVKLIFADLFGGDFINRQKQRAICWSVHNKGSLKVMVNGWQVDSVFSNDVDAVHNPLGLPHRMTSSDWYLAESFAVMNGAYDDADDGNGIKDYQDKAAKMTAYKSAFGTKMAAITTWDSSSYDADKSNFSYTLSVLNKFNAWGHGEENFSSVSCLLPFRTRSTFLGTKFTSGITTADGNIDRRMNVGIRIDTNTHTVGFLLD